MRLYRFECDDCGARSPAYEKRRYATRLVRAHDCSLTCAGCRYRSARHGARGLCVVCHRDPEIRLDHERKTWAADDLLDTWDELRREGLTPRQAAERMGIKFATLDQALCRAKRRGDPRAVRPWHPNTNMRWLS